MIDRHEGGESAALARRWFAEQPQAWYVVRDRPGADRHHVPVAVPPPTTRGARDRKRRDPAIAAARRQFGRTRRYGRASG